MADRVPKKEKIKPCVSLYLDYPVQFSIAAKPSTYRKWKKIQDDNGVSIKYKMTKFFLSLFDTTTWQSWKRENKVAASKLTKYFKEIFNDILGLDEKTLSALVQEMMEKEVAEHDNK